MSRSHLRARSRALLRPLPAALALAAAAAGPVAAQATGAARELPKGPHGATAFEAQEAELDRLLGDVDPTRVPAGVDEWVWRLFVPADALPTPERVALGRKLYFDPRLSRDDTVACATCHDVTRGFTDQRPVSEGVDDQLGQRNAPTTLNAFLLKPLFLDGRAATLEEQAGLPILNSVEMGMPDRETVVAKLAAIPEYPPLFRAAFGRDPTYEDVERAIAAFERTFAFLDAPLDRFLAGDEDAISADAKAGWALYNGKARCASCHPINTANLLGTDFKFHNVGVSARHQDFEGLAREAERLLAELEGEALRQAIDELAIRTQLSELGRFLVTNDLADMGSFRTLQVRNVGITPPYMHDGSMQTLWDVMDHYNKGGEANPFLDGGIEPLALTEEEIDQVVALMFALTDARFAEQNAAETERQRELAARQRPFRDTELALRRTLPFEERVMGADAGEGR